MDIKEFQINEHKIGPNHPCFVIGEAGLNHNGDFEIAKKLIDVAADNGCDCVKFQRRTVTELAVSSTLDAEDHRFPALGSTYREIREKHEFSAPQIKELMERAAERGLVWMCTPFDLVAADFLEQFDPAAYKIASHSVTNLALVEHIADIGRPTIMSSGMCSLDELDVAVNAFIQRKVPLGLMHCVSAYPTPPEQQNMSMIGVLKERYHIPVGYSGHELGTLPSLMSISMGVNMVERHITTDPTLIGFDHSLSLAPEQLGNMIRDIRLIESMMGTGEKFVTETEQVTRDKYRVSLASARDIGLGETITENMICFKNPGTGLGPDQKELILNKQTTIRIPKDVLITLDMINS